MEQDLSKFLDNLREHRESQDEILQNFRSHLTKDGEYRYSEIGPVVKSLLSHPGWKVVEDFVRFYIQRNSLKMALAASDPETALGSQNPEMFVPPMDGPLWAAKLARLGGEIKGLDFVLNLPVSILGDVANATAIRESESESDESGEFDGPDPTAE